MMSKHGSSESGMPAYLLPEDSQFRLKKLRDYMAFLARLALPRTMDEAREGEPVVTMGEVATCLELLAEQAGLVLDEVSWPAGGEAAASASVPGAEAALQEGGEGPGNGAGRLVFGVTLDQVDAIHRLINRVLAHGDVVVASDTAELAHYTLPLLGDAICEGVFGVRELLGQVEAQRLSGKPPPRTGVSQERGLYAVALAA